jgi:cyanophycinase
MEHQSGDLVIIGGGEDRRGKCEVLGHFVALAGGARARVAVLAAASEDGGEVGRSYERVFRRLGAADVMVLRLEHRADAEDEGLCSSLASATAAFFTGGDQLRITATLGGTRLLDALYALHRNGGVLAGTSAGASIMSATMIVGGQGDEPARRAVLSMCPGLGLLPGTVIDQHFAQRGRLNRLLAAISQNPGILGVGIDEDTAVVVHEDTLSVIGSGTVTFLDGRPLTFSNASESGQEDPLALLGVVAHVLPAGYRFDLAGRRPLLPHSQDAASARLEPRPN